MTEKQPQYDAFVEQLSGLKPASAPLDAREVFYQAGFAACQMAVQGRALRQVTIAVSASILLTALATTLLFRPELRHVSTRAEQTQNTDLNIATGSSISSPSISGGAAAANARANEMHTGSMVTRNAQPSASPWWMALAQPSQLSLAIISSTESLSSVYRFGSSAEDWERFAKIPRPIAPAVDEVELVPALNSPPLSPWDAQRAKDLFPWL